MRLNKFRYGSEIYTLDIQRLLEKPRDYEQVHKNCLQQYYLKSRNTINDPTPTTTNLVTTLDCLSQSSAKIEISPTEIEELKLATPP